MEKVETAVLITYIVEMMREKDISVVIPTHKYRLQQRTNIQLLLPFVKKGVNKVHTSKQNSTVTKPG